VERQFGRVWFGLCALMSDYSLTPDRMLPYVHLVVDQLNKLCKSSGKDSPYIIRELHAPPSHAQRLLFHILYPSAPVSIPSCKSFAIGEEVLYLLPKWLFSKNASTGMKVSGMRENYVIIEKLDDLVYRIQPSSGNALHRHSSTVLAHVDFLSKRVLPNVANPESSLASKRATLQPSLPLPVLSNGRQVDQEGVIHLPEFGASSSAKAVDPPIEEGVIHEPRPLVRVVDGIGRWTESERSDCVGRCVFVKLVQPSGRQALEVVSILSICV
jgi:hypothetical protein